MSADKQLMGKDGEQKTFQMNPVEIIVFTVVILVFANSVYNLIYDWKGIHVAPDEVATSTPDRSLASPRVLDDITIDCANSTHQVNASKVKLNGALCGIPAGEEAAQLVSSEVVNKTNESNAEVFPDTHRQQFSTDYIPLQPGTNLISLKFVYQTGKTYQVETTIKKN